MTVEKLQNAYYVTSDMEKSVAFYRDALGLDLTFRDGRQVDPVQGGRGQFRDGVRRRGA